jgi:excisionase family DNA binding protein
MERNKDSIIVEFPGATLLSRRAVCSVLGIGISTLDSLISDKELPRIRLSRHVYVLRSDLEKYILAHRSTGGAV